MISRAIIPLLLLIVITDAFFHMRFLRHKPWWAQLLWWLPSIALGAWCVKLSLVKGFLGESQGEIELFLFTYCLFMVPKAIFAICSALGRMFGSINRMVRRPALQRRRRNYGNLIGLLAAVAAIYIIIYGSSAGFYDIKVRRVELSFTDLPKAFDGYRIVQFSDAHVGTLRGARQELLRQMVDSINAQRPDMIAFTGDMQNTQPQDIYPHLDLLAELKARDGIFSVLGNHDYADYVDCDEAVKVANCRETISLQKQLGWTVLLNEHRRVSRKNGSIVVAGMENDGEGRFPQLGDAAKTLSGTSPTDFTILLEHDPTSWRRKILPHTHAQLTLSGHTHGGQFSLFGWTPASLRYKEAAGLYEENGRWINVSVGVGALIPFRFGQKGEIVVITLKKK